VHIHDVVRRKITRRSARLALGMALPLGVLVAAPAVASAQSSPTATARAAGPAATLAPLSGGHGVFMGEASSVNLKAVGYVQHEFSAAGTATSYAAVGGLNHDGSWTLAPNGHAHYTTRVLVRLPADPHKFSGTVVFEWLNVSGGLDADPEWASLHEEITRSGDAWVGVSAQAIGVMGGPVLVSVPVHVAGFTGVLGKGLRRIDPARYRSLHHPGDAFSYDIYTQVARAIRTGAGLGGLRPRHVIAAGESQSAYAMVTYYNGVQPLTHQFDGFFVHSRGASELPLPGPGQPADLAHAVSQPAVLFRTDQSAPVLDLQSEADVIGILNSYAARQPDNAHFRLWEVAGTAHADLHLVGTVTAEAVQCGVPINNGPMHVVAKAALHALTTWVDTGRPPVHAPRLDVMAGATPQVARASDGIALGGIRTAPVDVPVAALSGAPGPNPSVICLLLGSTVPFPAPRLHQLYSSRAAYLAQYRAAVAATITAGFALPHDRAALMAFADPSAVSG
jgi:hypothetical protein